MDFGKDVADPGGFTEAELHIFQKKLRENVERSAIIQYVTSSAFLRDAAEDLYSEPENLVYAGGGHTVLQFEDERQAVSFASRVTEQAMRRFDGLELFAKKMKYDSSTTPEENLKKVVWGTGKKESAANLFLPSDKLWRGGD